MLSHAVLSRQDIGKAASYYEDGVDDYYAKDGEASEWQGRGAEALGLSGAVDQQRFREMLAGNIGPGIRPSRDATRDDSKQRIGIDLTFSAPKSVSLQALVAGDAEIIKAHDRAVHKALEVAETLAQARTKERGKTRIEDTGNLVVAKFRHETSREQDPQLHTHALVMNITQRADGQWRALKNDKLIKSTMYLGSVYNAELAAELQKLGHTLRFEKDGNFELAHIDRKQIEGFSQRRAQIDQALAAKGLDRETATPEQKKTAAMTTRAKKEATERQALHQEWQAKAKDLGIDFGRKEWAGAGAEKGKAGRSVNHQVPTEEAAKNSVKYAINHLTERQAVMGQENLIDTAMKHAVGNARIEDITQEIARQRSSGYLIQEQPLYKPASSAPGESSEVKTRDMWISDLQAKGLQREQARTRVDNAIAQGGLVAGEVRYTTQTALERERSILNVEQQGRAAVPAIMSADKAREQLAETNLNAGQREAAAMMVTSENRVTGVQGYAGVGKSHMLDTAKTMIEAEGYTVRALAPYATQVKALRELNVEANTLASFLKAKDKGLDSRTVLVIDEAGTVPTRQMQQALKLAEKAGARVVLMGDTAQTKAIEAGRPFDQLQAAGMQTARMDEIQRQKNPELKKAVELAAKGEAAASLQKIPDVTEIADAAERRAAVANAYIELQPDDRAKTIIVSGTNEARREINANVREGLGLTGQGENVDMLIRRDTTQAERRFSKHYVVGDMIQPEKNYRSGLNQGELYRVDDTGPGNRLTVTSQITGERIQFNPMTHGKISVYEQDRGELAAGDLVRITRNDAGMDIANGDRFKVASIGEGKVTLASETRTIELPTDKPLHISLAYATTVHSSQGLTADRVMIDADAKSKTTAKDVYYVAISRARFVSRIFTNSKKDLPKAIARENTKFNAHDLALGRDRAGQQQSAQKEASQQTREASRQTEKSRDSSRERGA